MALEGIIAQRPYVSVSVVVKNVLLKQPKADLALHSLKQLSMVQRMSSSTLLVVLTWLWLKQKKLQKSSTKQLVKV